MSQVVTCLKDIATPKGAYLSAQYKKSFAYHTLQERAPIILTNFLDHLVIDRCEIIEQYEGDSAEEIKQIIGHISKLKNELQTNKKLQPIKGHGSDVKTWNNFLESFTESQDFYTTVFLYAECYLYRRIQEAFDLTLVLTVINISVKTLS
ncbi:protein-glutamate O-methyltransferase-like [Ctenocephalides felis]|uniref:protein-glutamate O-methyltransferase-like n=1 Tax=Ctenocephalides felis TaxID=7515 RepID=UPI000E6E3E1D|nr:protein-glutamate O-methyltransferase-like [Ctenocephalides felis]